MLKNIIINNFKLLSFLLLIGVPKNTSAQSYISDIGSPEIDTLRKELLKSLRDTDYEKAITLADSFHLYWKERVNTYKDQAVLQNYYYATIKRIEPRRRLDVVSKDELKNLYALEKTIVSNLTSQNNLLPYYYKIAAELKAYVERDFEASIDYTDKSIDISMSYDTVDYISVAKDIISKGYSYSSLLKHDKARACFDEALKIKKEHNPNDTLSILFSMYPLTFSCHLEKKYDEGLQIIDEALEIATTFLPQTHDLYIGILRIKGVLHAELGDIPNALKMALLSLEAAKLKNQKTELDLNFQYQSIAGYYGELGQLNLANIYIDSAIAIIKKTKTNRRLTASYLDKATYASDLNSMIEISEKALATCPNDPLCLQTDINHITHNLGNFYFRKGNKEVGLNYLLKVADLREADIKNYGHNLPQNYRALADIYQSLNQSDLAIAYQKKALRMVKMYRPDTSFYVARQTSKLGTFYLQKGKLDLAESLLLESKPILENELGAFNPDMIYNYISLSKVYTEKREYDLALKYGSEAFKNVMDKNTLIKEEATEPLLQLARIYSLKDMPDSTEVILNKLLFINGFEPFQNNKVNNYTIPVHSQWLSYLALSQAVYLEDELLDNDVEFLVSKIKTGIQLIDKLRSDFFFEKSEQQFQKSTQTFFDWSIKQLSKQYAQSNDQNLLELIFECFEKNKSIAINRNFTRYQAVQKENVPENIIEREKQLIVSYENAYKKHESHQSEDSLKSIYLNKMYNLLNNREAFLDTLKNQYPKYYNSRYAHQIINLTQLKEYAQKESRSFFITHWADSVLYRIVVTPSFTNFSATPTSQIEPLIDKIQAIVSQPMMSRNELYFQNTKLDFIKQSSALYKTLLEFDNSDSLSFNLTIISDGKLTQFPFDILLTQASSENVSYKAMPFLIKSHAINYLGSATQHLQLSENPLYKNDQTYTGFAPSYHSTVDSDSLIPFRSTTTLDPLLYNIEEVSNTRLLFDGTEFIGQNATEYAFRNIENKYGYLHLAMHTTIDNDFPLDSYLNFAPDGISEDSKLYVHEIAKMNLNHNLVVLSACETNKGNDISGEGILGIARAFQIASCPNLIASNWLVEDRSAGNIIYHFFKGLKQNTNPSNALRAAKLDFLESSSVIKSHPFYWAGFSYYGNPTIQSESVSNSKVWIFGSLAIGLILFIVFTTRKKS